MVTHNTLLKMQNASLRSASLGEETEFDCPLDNVRRLLIDLRQQPSLSQWHSSIDDATKQLVESSSHTLYTPGSVLKELTRDGRVRQEMGIVSDFIFDGVTRASVREVEHRHVTSDGCEVEERRAYVLQQAASALREAGKAKALQVVRLARARSEGVLEATLERLAHGSPIVVIADSGGAAADMAAYGREGLLPSEGRQRCVPAHAHIRARLRTPLTSARRYRSHPWPPLVGIVHTPGLRS